MLKVTKHESNTIYYTCDCGARGMCSLKPANKDSAIVIDLRCPSCQETERITILQYSDEDNRLELLHKLKNRSGDLAWVPSINEEILYDEG